MSEALISKVMSLTGKYVATFEVPPGIGKTYSAIRKALDWASEGKIVIFGLPNHHALITAFAYAIKYYVETLMKKLPRKKLPYIVYYEGVRRFCPFFSKKGNILFRKAVNWMIKNSFLDPDLVELLKDLSIEEISNIYGSMYICKYLCPVYKQQKYFDNEKIFVSEKIVKQTNVSKLFVSPSERTIIVDAITKVEELRKKGLVAYISPEIGSNGEPGGYCLRAILSKAITSNKVQLVMKGVLILTPVQAVDFIYSIVTSRVKALRNRGFALPSPVVVMDEYDFYIYRPLSIPVFTIKQLETEKKITEEIVSEESEKRINGDPSYNWEKLVAALIANLILSRLEEIYNEFMEEVKKKESIEPAGSPACLFAEAAATPVVAEEIVIPPLAPRKIILKPLLDLPAYIYETLEEIHDTLVNEQGISYYVLDDVKSLGLKYFLTLWENILVNKCKEKGLKFKYPALYRSYGRVYRLGYVYLDKYVSIAKTIMRLISKKRNVIAVYYRLIPTSKPVYVEERGREKKASSTGKFILQGAYDLKFYKLFSGDADVLLMSATGLPWHAPFYLTRSEGEGAKIYDLKQACSRTITTIFESMRIAEGGTKEYTYLDITTPRTRPIRAVMLDPNSRFSYAEMAIIYPVRDLPMLPFGGEITDRYLMMLLTALKPYTDVALTVTTYIQRNKPKEIDKCPSLFVLTQRKDVAAAFAYQIIARLVNEYSAPYRLELCSGVKCNDVYEVLAETENISVADLVRVVRENKLSHIVVYTRIEGEEFRYYITWLRSKMSRGIDLPEDTIPYAVLLVGTPYRPPEALDVVPRKGYDMEAVRRASYIMVYLYIGVQDPKNMVVLVHNPIDIAESVNEFVQAVGRALRKAWKESLRRGRKIYNVIVIIPDTTYNKIFTYSPMWFRDAFFRR